MNIPCGLELLIEVKTLANPLTYLLNKSSRLAKKSDLVLLDYCYYCHDYISSCCSAHYPLLLLFTTATITTTRYYDYYYYNDYSSLFYFIIIIIDIIMLIIFYHHYHCRWSMIVIVSIIIVIIIPIVHTRVYQLCCYRHQYIDTSLLTENGRRPWRRSWRFNIGKSTGSHPHYIEVRRNWRTDVERTCLCLRLSSCNTGMLFNTPPCHAMDTHWRLVARSHV